MFSILPADEQKTAALAKREGTPLPVVALTLTVNGVEDGYVLYRMHHSRAEIVCLRSPAEEYEEWLVRAALNSAVNRNAIDAICRDPMLFPLLQKLGFSAKGEHYEVFIPEFFTRPCNGG